MKRLLCEDCPCWCAEGVRDQNIGQCRFGPPSVTPPSSRVVFDNFPLTTNTSWCYRGAMLSATEMHIDMAAPGTKDYTGYFDPSKLPTKKEVLAVTEAAFNGALDTPEPKNVGSQVAPAQRCPAKKKIATKAKAKPKAKAKARRKTKKANPHNL